MGSGTEGNHAGSTATSGCSAGALPAIARGQVVDGVLHACAQPDHGTSGRSCWQHARVVHFDHFQSGSREREDARKLCKMRRLACQQQYTAKRRSFDTPSNALKLL